MSISDCIKLLESSSISMAQSHIDKFKTKQKHIFQESLKGNKSLTNDNINIIMSIFDLSQNCIDHSDMLSNYNDLCMEITDSIAMSDHYKYARTSGVLNNRNNTKDAIIREEINNNVLFNSKKSDKSKRKTKRITHLVDDSEDELCEEAPLQ